MRPASFFLLLLASGAMPAVTSAQVRVSAGITLPLAGDLGGPEWTEGPGARGTITFPAYGGEFRMALDVAEHETDDEALPEFVSINATLGWGPVVSLGPVRLSPGAEVGGGQFMFDDDSVFGENVSSESELLAGLYLRAGIPLAGRVEAWAETGVRRTFFSETQTTAGASGGLTLRLW